MLRASSLPQDMGAKMPQGKQPLSRLPAAAASLVFKPITLKNANKSHPRKCQLDWRGSMKERLPG